MSDFKDLLTYVQQHPSIDVVVVDLSWNNLRIFANTFPNIQGRVLSDFHRHEFKGPNQLIVLNSTISGHMIFSETRHQNQYDALHTALSKQPKFDATVVFLDPACTTFCLGGIQGRNIIEQLSDCPIPQNNTVPSVWRGMVDNYANQMQQRRLNAVLEHEMDNPINTKKKM